MNAINPKQKERIVFWAKRGTIILTFIVWAVVWMKIFQGGGTFGDQAPQCIISTMLLFGLLTAIHKGLEYWEQR